MIRKISRVAMLLVLIILAFHGLTIVGEYIGYASFAGEGGNIYELVIKHHIPVDQWAGIYGVAVTVPGFFILQTEDLAGGDVESENFLFNCLAPNEDHEIYAAVFDDFDLSSATAATTAEVDAFYGLNVTAVDSAGNTFTSNITFELGTLSITAPGTHTYKIDETGTPMTFATAAIKDALGRVGLVILLTTNFTEGFNGDIINFQGILPVYTNTSPTTYYFYTDPNDQCPAGTGEAPPTGVLIGNVSDQGANRLPGVIVEVFGTAGLTDATGFYNISPPIGTHRIYAILTGYKTYVNNVTILENETNIHNIVMVEDEPNPLTGVGPGQDDPGDQTETGVGPGEDVGPGQSDGEDVGPGEAPPVPYVEEPKQIEGTDYIISLSEIKRKIRIDTFHQESLYVYSFKKSSVQLSFTLIGENLSNIMTLDKQQMIVEPNGNDRVIITLWGRPPVGVYKGNLTIDGEINATIPVEIEILPKDQLPVEALLMSIETNQKSVLPGDRFKFKTDLRNLLVDQQYPVNLLFTIQPMEGNETVWVYETNVFLKTAFSLIRSVDLPKNIPAGDYVIRASARYIGLSSSTSTIFQVDVPFWSRTFLGLKNWIWAIIIAVLAAGSLAGYLLYRNIQSKKKYHLKVDYSELPKPGPRNVYVGKIAETENKTYMNLENFKVHTIVAGSTGGGKSVSAQIIVEEALERDVAVICFDPTAQWTGMLRPCKDKTMFSLYPFFGMKKTDAKSFNGNVRMISDPREQIDIKKYAKPGEIQVFACHKLDPKDMDIVVANAIRAIFHANFQESKPLKILFVFDEVHRLLPKFGGSGDGFLQIERGCREFRKWGLGIVLVSQTLSDFVGTIKANINTEVQMRTRDEGDLERIRQKYGEGVLRSLVKATVGSGMVENPAYNRGQPYFVAFRPLKHSVERMADDEIEQYNKYNDMIDSLVYSLEQLEEEKIDVFDLKLELKLALDKVKQGNFNMVQIYLEGLTPRIDKHWEKLGKTPKKFVRELVDESALKEELKKAQAERDKYVADKEKEGGDKEEEKKEWEWTDDAPPDKLLNLKNGMVVLSLASMFDEVSAMKDADWDQEVGEGFNNLADWVKDATGLETLANNMYTTKDKTETLNFLGMVRDGKDLPEAKPPEGTPAQGDQPAEEAPPAPDPEKSVEETKSAEAPAESQSEPEQPAQPKDSTPAETPGPDSEKPAEEAKPVEVPAQNSEQSAEEVKSQEGALPAQSDQPVEETKPPEAQQTEPTTQKEPASETPPVPEQETPPKEPAPETQKPPDSGGGAQSAPPVESVSEQPRNANPSGLEALVTDNPNEFFVLENGTQLRSAKELADYLPNMEDDIFQNHVGTDYNHFADWINGVFHDETLANKIRGAATKDEMLAVMQG